MQCEGWRRYGGIMTFGPPRWEQCKNEATINMTVEQEGKVSTLPACNICWNEAIERDMKIIKTEPIINNKTKEGEKENAVQC